MFQWRNPLWEQLPLVSIINPFLPRHKRCWQTWTIHSCQGKTKGMILSLPISPNRQPYSSHFVSYLSDTPCHSYLYFICVFHVSHSCNNTWMNFMLYYANTTNQDPLTSQTCCHLCGTLVILLCVSNHRYLALSSWRAFANARWELLNTIICPLLAHGDSKGMQGVEHFCSESTAFKVNSEEF